LRQCSRSGGSGGGSERYPKALPSPPPPHPRPPSDTA
jgi:hypothetical protein